MPSPPPPWRSTEKHRKTTWIWPLLLLILIVLVASISVLWIQNQITESGFSSNRSARQVIIGNDTLRIPQNYLRFRKQRQASTLKQVNLVMLYPGGEGFSKKLAEQFKQTKDLIFITLKKKEQDYDMNGRLIPIYQHLLDGSEIPGPAGLTMRGFKRDVGYNGETLATYQDGAETWVARCYPITDESQSTCFRDMFMGKTLAVFYRFNSNNLQHWKAIDTLVKIKVENMLIR